MVGMIGSFRKMGKNSTYLSSGGSLLILCERMDTLLVYMHQ
jgi:hypothetical protein